MFIPDIFWRVYSSLVWWPIHVLVTALLRVVFRITSPNPVSPKMNAVYAPQDISAEQTTEEYMQTIVKLTSILHSRSEQECKCRHTLVSRKHLTIENKTLLMVWIQTILRMFCSILHGIHYILLLPVKNPTVVENL